jgi:hypothetical protein
MKHKRKSLKKSKKRLVQFNWSPFRSKKLYYCDNNSINCKKYPTEMKCTIAQVEGRDGGFCDTKKNCKKNCKTWIDTNLKQPKNHPYQRRPYGSSAQLSDSFSRVGRGSSGVGVNKYLYRIKRKFRKSPVKLYRRSGTRGRKSKKISKKSPPKYKLYNSNSVRSLSKLRSSPKYKLYESNPLAYLSTPRSSPNLFRTVRKSSSKKSSLRYHPPKMDAFDFEKILNKK